MIRKRCSKCGKTKSLASFSKDRQSKDGLRSYCRLCSATYYADWYSKHAEAQRAYTANYRKTHRNWKRVANAKWAKANPEKMRIAITRWRRAHPDKEQDRHVRRLARKKGAAVEAVSRQVVYERDGGLCHICGQKARPKNWHLDHIVPLSKGGEHSYQNVAVSHPGCNLHKGSKRLVDVKMTITPVKGESK